MVGSTPFSARIPKKVTVSIDLDFLSDAVFRAKLVFFAPLLVVFLFSAYLFTRADFHIFNLVEFSRLAYNLSKLYSLAFVLFLVAYGLSLALAVFYGFRQRLVPVVLSGLVLVVAAAALGLAFPNYLPAFVILAVTTGAAMFFASHLERLSLGSGWSASGKALLLFVLLAFLFIGASAQGDRDKLFNMGVAQLVGGLSTTAGSAAVGVCAAGLDSLTISEDSVRAGFPQAAFQEIYTKNLPLTLKSDPAVLAASSSAYNETISLVTVGVNNFKGQLIAYLSQAPAGNATTATPTQLAGVKAAIQNDANLRPVFDNFGWFLAFLSLTLLYLVKFIAQLVAAVFTWGLSKL